MIIDQTIDRAISKMLIDKQVEERSNHISSGKLSASGLGKPLQWQILKTIGVEGKPLDEYVLRFFLRGKTIEDWVLENTPNVIDKQKLVEYKGAIGYVDAVVDYSNYESQLSILPTEIKSVKNSKYARIMTQGEPDRSHSLQACMYAMAMNCDKFGIIYIAADDLRLTNWIIDTKKFSKQVDDIIENYNSQMAKGILPAFDPPEKWMSSKQYSDYPDWQDLTEEECQLKLASEFPEAYQKLLSFKK